MALQTVKLTPRFPIAVDLIGPWRGILDALRDQVDPKVYAELEAKVTVAEQQAAELNKILSALSGNQQDVLTNLDAVDVAVTIINGTPAPDPTVVYELPIVGPSASITGTAYLALTSPVPVGVHGSSIRLSFYWEATDPTALAQWRLRNVTAGVTILDGNRAAPFGHSYEESTAAAAAMPAEGDEVSLEFSYTSAAGGGEIEMTGSAKWEVQ